MFITLNTQKCGCHWKKTSLWSSQNLILRVKMHLHWTRTNTKRCDSLRKLSTGCKLHERLLNLFNKTVVEWLAYFDQVTYVSTNVRFAWLRVQCKRILNLNAWNWPCYSTHFRQKQQNQCHQHAAADERSSRANWQQGSLGSCTHKRMRCYIETNPCNKFWKQEPV